MSATSIVSSNALLLSRASYKSYARTSSWCCFASVDRLLSASFRCCCLRSFGISSRTFSLTSTSSGCGSRYKCSGLTYSSMLSLFLVKRNLTAREFSLLLPPACETDPESLIWLSLLRASLPVLLESCSTPMMREFFLLASFCSEFFVTFILRFELATETVSSSGGPAVMTMRYCTLWRSGMCRSMSVGTGSVSLSSQYLLRTIQSSFLVS